MTKKMTRQEAGRLGGKANKRGPRGINVAVRMPPATVAALDLAAAELKEDRSFVVRAAVDEYLARWRQPTEQDVCPGHFDVTATWHPTAAVYTIRQLRIETQDGVTWRHMHAGKTPVGGHNWDAVCVTFVGGPLNGKKLT